MTVRHDSWWEALLLLGSTLVIGCAHHGEARDADNTTQAMRPETSSVSTADGITVKNSLHRVYFSTDSADLSADDVAILDKDVELLKRFPTVRIMIQGHADERGGLTYNLNLGETRASNVRQYLVDHGIDLSRVVIVSAGEGEPDGDVDTPTELAGDRRTDFILLWELPTSETATHEAMQPH